jgi:hypothetical protein
LPVAEVFAGEGRGPGKPMEMLLFSFAGSLLAFFAVLAANASAASAQAAAATNWPPTQAQQQALQVQISDLVSEVGQPLTADEQTNLQALLANAPSQYQATLPAGTPATFAGYSAWVLAGSASQASAQASANAYGEAA